MQFQFLLISVASVLVFLILLGLVLGRLYRRSTREVSLVKTGAGGKRVIMDGGTIVVPLLHEVSPVNMKTLRLEVQRNGDASLITQDRMRVDVGVEFYVSVNATEEGIARAAQTLGDRTFDVNQLREMIEGKLVDGLRAVAAQMTMDGLHENRADFVQEVQNAVSEDLLKNGLSLESVSLTALDQTPFEALDENNAFNAVGMRKLAEVIANSKMERAQIEAESQVAVRRAHMEAERERLSIEQDELQAEIEQVKQVELMRAAQEAEIAQRREQSEQEKERARISREESIRSAEIARDRDLEVAEQERQVIIAQKSEEESRARASADLARAEATKATESVITAREVAEAERQKQIVLIEATQEAERQATAIRLSAQAEKEAAADRADARREEAQAEADALNIRAEAKKNDMLAEAEGKRAIVEADNVLSDEQIRMKVDLARIEAMPGIIAEMVKPAEKIDSIKIHQVSGIGSNGSAADGGLGGGGGGDKPVVNQALDSIMGMAVQMPALKKLGEELGLSMEDGVSGLANGALSSQPAALDSETAALNRVEKKPEVAES